MIRPQRFGLVLVSCVLWTALSGCVLGPTALRASRTAYNKVVQATTAEQLLLNLVRLHYREAPLFLDVGSIATQFTFQGSGEVANTLNQNIPREAPTPDVWEWGAGLSYREQPTLTFSPLQGEEFVQRLLTPVGLDKLLLLTGSGWRVDRVLRICVQSMNGLDNASNASSPTPKRAPEYVGFARVSAALRNLQRDRRLEIGYELRRQEHSGPLAVEWVAPADLIAAVRDGLVFRLSADRRAYTLTGPERVVVWRVPPDASDASETREIVELLGLTPHRSSYDIAEIGGFRPTAPAGERTHIEVSTRSLLGTMFYLSQAVEVPEVHRKRGLVTTTVDVGGEPFDWSCVIGDLLQVHSQATPPVGAAVAVHYRGHWFYIDDADLSSKTTFALLGQLFALQAGSEAGFAPVLTLPLSG